MLSLTTFFKPALTPIATTLLQETPAFPADCPIYTLLLPVLLVIPAFPPIIIFPIVLPDCSPADVPTKILLLALLPNPLPAESPRHTLSEAPEDVRTVLEPISTFLIPSTKPTPELEPKMALLLPVVRPFPAL